MHGSRCSSCLETKVAPAPGRSWKRWAEAAGGNPMSSMLNPRARLEMLNPGLFLLAALSGSGQGQNRSSLSAQQPAGPCSRDV